MIGRGRALTLAGVCVADAAFSNAGVGGGDGGGTVEQRLLPDEPAHMGQRFVRRQ